MEEKDFEKKPKKKVGLIITVVVLVLVALIAAGGFVYLKFFNNKPQKIFEKAISKVFEMAENDKKNEAKVNLELTASVNSKEQDTMMLNTYLQMLKLNFTAEVNIDKKIVNEGISISAFDEPIISVEGLTQDNNVYFLLNNIYSKYIQVPSKDMEEINLEGIFEAEETSEELINSLKQLLLEEIESKELKQENVKVDDKNLTKTTLNLSVNEVKQIVTKIVKELYKTTPNEELKNVITDLKEANIENTDNYIEISIYTTKLTGKIVKTELTMINVVADEAAVVTISEKEDDKKEIVVAMNEDSIDINKASTICTLTIKKEAENKGTLTVKVNIDEDSSITVTAKYSIDYNVSIEPKNVRNSIMADQLTDADFEEMKTNIENNELLYGIIQSFISPEGLFEDDEVELKKDSIDNYDDLDYNNLDNNDFANNYSEATINNI